MLSSPHETLIFFPLWKQTGHVRILNHRNPSAETLSSNSEAQMGRPKPPGRQMTEASGQCGVLVALFVLPLQLQQQLQTLPLQQRGMGLLSYLLRGWSFAASMNGSTLCPCLGLSEIFIETSRMGVKPDLNPKPYLSPKPHITTSNPNPAYCGVN